MRMRRYEMRWRQTRKKNESRRGGKKVSRKKKKKKKGNKGEKKRKEKKRAETQTQIGLIIPEEEGWPLATICIGRI